MSKALASMRASKHNPSHNVSCVYRILELKHEMMNLELLEFHYFDDILADMKLTPVSYPCQVVMPNQMKGVNPTDCKCLFIIHDVLGVMIVILMSIM